MTNQLYEKRTLKLAQSLVSSGSSGCDGAWIIQPKNRFYLSGFSAEDGSFTESSGSLFLGEKVRLLVTDSRYTLAAESETQNFEVYTLKKPFAEEMPRFMQAVNFRRMGFEEHYLTCALYREAEEKLSGLSPPTILVPMDEAVEKMRQEKDAFEINALQTAANMISEIIDHVILNLKPGMTEKQVAWQIENLAREAGTDSLSFPVIVASGPNSALPHAVPTQRALKPGEPVLLDAGVRLNGYCSDMTRTVFLGEPGPYFKKIYQTVRQAQLAALQEIRSGVTSTDVDTAARELIGEAGFGQYFGHGLGHGVGLAIHERPSLGPRKPVVLQTGNVFTVEPGIYIPGKGGVRLEEMVVLEESGARVLTLNNHFYDF